MRRLLGLPLFYSSVVFLFIVTQFNELLVARGFTFMASDSLEGRDKGEVTLFFFFFYRSHTSTGLHVENKARDGGFLL